MVSRKGAGPGGGGKECRVQIYPGFGLAVLTATIRGTDAGGGSGFPMRLCSGGQTQPQVDPKQQQQQVQSNIPMSFAAQPSRPTTIFPRPSTRLNPPRPHMISQTLPPNANIQYSAPTMLLPPPPPYPQTVITLPHTSQIASGRHQSHGGGQGAGTGGAPAPAYYTSQGQYIMQPPIPTYTQYPSPYMFPLRNSSFPTQNPGGAHPGAAAPQPPQHQPQQYVVEGGGVRGGGGGGGGGGGQMMAPPHQPQQPAQPPVRQRRIHAIPIVNPQSGKDITEELYSENNSGESTASATPHSFPPNDKGNGEVAAEFAAKVAAAAVAPTTTTPTTEVVLQPSIPNGPSSSSPPPPTAASPPVEVPPIASPPQPLPPLQPQPPPPQAQIPTVSAKTDSPTVELPRPKALTHSPGRKSTPVPSAVQPVLDNPKKKDKKVTGIGGNLPPHREEPEEAVRRSSFADAINIKNLQPVPAPAQLPAPTPPPPAPVQPTPPEPETNGEPEVVPPPPAPAPQPKHHEKPQEQQQASHDRGKTLPKNRGKGKKGGVGKEQNRRWQEKEGGGSDMDAFMSAPPAAPSPPPPADPEPAPAPPPQQPAPERQPTPPPTPPPQAPSPPPPSSNKNTQNEDEVEEMDESEELDEESIIVAVKNEENAKVSAPVADEIEETIVNETPVIEKAKPLLKYTYKEGQWSPLNPEGKKVYDRDFLLTLRSDDLSTKRPDIEDCDIIKTDSTNNNSISANNNNNNRRQLHGSNSMSMSRNEGSFLPPFMKSSASQRGSGMGMGGKRGSQQGGRPSRDGRSRNPYPSQQYKDSDMMGGGELHWQKGGGWKPDRCKTPPKLTEEEIKTENLYKKVRGILNKLTPQKFDKLMEQILELPIDTIERLTGVVGLVFDKAVDEPSFSRAYAKLCQNLNKLSIKIADNEGNTPNSDVSFRKILLTKCQHMFEKKKREEKEGEEGKKSEEERVAELQQQIAEETDKDKKKELQLMLEEEERKIRVKYVGLARFIGELFKLSMLTSKIMFGCISTLLEKIEEESLECLCKLLTTVGKELEAQAKATNSMKDLDECFAKMKNLAKKSANSKVSSRVRFMLQDVIELRGNKWVPRREDNNPKTMDQIQREAERETLLESVALSQASNTPRSKHSDRGDDRRRGGPRGGGGGNIQDSDGWIVSNKFRNYTFEASKLQHLKGTDSEPASQNLGSHGQFQKWSYGSGAGSKLQSTTSDRRGMEYSTTNKFALLQEDKKMPPMMSRKITPSSSLEKERAVQSVRDALAEKPNRNQSSNPPSRDNSRARSGASKPAPAPQVTAPEQEAPAPAAEKLEPEDPEVIKMKSWNLLQEWLANHNVQESADSITEAFPDPIIFVHAVMEKVIEGKEAQRIAFGELLANLISMKIVTPLGVAKELGEIIEFGEDSMIDLPFIWKYLGELLVPLLAKGVFTFGDLKISCEEFRTPHLATTLTEIIVKLLKEKGPVFIKSQWESSQVKFSDFIPEANVDEFIKKNNFGFIIGEGEIETNESVIPMNEVENILYKFLVQDGDKVSDYVCEWVKANVGSNLQDVDFIKALVRAVIKTCLKNEKIVPGSLNKHSTLLKKFIDTNETRELACLNSIMHMVVNEEEYPVSLLVDLFQNLNENNIISFEAFMKWKRQDINEKGKRVALASLTSFYVNLSEQEESNDDST